MFTREDHIKEARMVFNHIGLLYDTTVTRCTGFAEDEIDYYWITVINGVWSYHSKVGSFISLKDLNYPRYEYLEDAMETLWGSPKEKEFIIKWIGE